MHRHAVFGNAAQLVEHGLMGIASAFAAKFDALVQAAVKNELDGGLEITDIHGYADHAPAFYRDGFGMPDLFGCVVRVRGRERATAVGRLWANEVGMAIGELHIGDKDDLIVVEGSIEEVAEKLAKASVDEITDQFSLWTMKGLDDGPGFPFLPEDKRGRCEPM